MGASSSSDGRREDVEPERVMDLPDDACCCCGTLRDDMVMFAEMCSVGCTQYHRVFGSEDASVSDVSLTNGMLEK